MNATTPHGAASCGAPSLDAVHDTSPRCHRIDWQRYAAGVDPPRVPDCEPSPDYLRLAAEHRPTAEAWDAFVRATLLEPWLRAYRQATPWRSDVMEIVQGALTYLFDAAPTMDGLHVGDDRVVAVWGRSRRADGPRESRSSGGLHPESGELVARGARPRALRRACRRRWHGHELLSASDRAEPRHDG